jgi:hypothetical protein
MTSRPLKPDVPFRLVCATRGDSRYFEDETALGRWVRRFALHHADIQVTLYQENRTALPIIYNAAIEAAADNPAILVFIHDDVHLLDLFWQYQLWQGLSQFDIIGLAGSAKCRPGQSSWAFVDNKYTWDSAENLSGTVAHGKQFPPESIIRYGEVPKACQLLDGVFLAADSRRLIASELRFDPQFKFHFYDLDFCRQATLKGLTLGTWPISIGHESAGGFGDSSWNEAYQLYLAKYGETAIA